MDTVSEAFGTTQLVAVGNQYFLRDGTGGDPSVDLYDVQDIDPGRDGAHQIADHLASRDIHGVAERLRHNLTPMAPA